MSRRYTVNSLQNRIRQFFLDNPEEELSYADMAVKFGCTADQARWAVYDLGQCVEPLEFEAYKVIRLKRGEAVA